VIVIAYKNQHLEFEFLVGKILNLIKIDLSATKMKVRNALYQASERKNVILSDQRLWLAAGQYCSSYESNQEKQNESMRLPTLFL
jgi:hypothetical protein